MRDPKKPAEPEESPMPAPDPYSGLFGAFGEVYRARWTANHASMRRRKSAENAGAPPEASSLPSSPGATQPRTEDGPRWIRSWERS